MRQRPVERQSRRFAAARSGARLLLVLGAVVLPLLVTSLPAGARDAAGRDEARDRSRARPAATERLPREWPGAEGQGLLSQGEPRAADPVASSVNLDPKAHATLVNNTGSVTIDVPVGAVAGTAILFYSPTPTATLPAPLVPVEAFALTIQPGLTPQRPYVIAVRYEVPNPAGVAAGTLRLAYRDGAGRWISLPSYVDAENRLVSAATTALGQFALVGSWAPLTVYIPVALLNTTAGW